MKISSKWLKMSEIYKKFVPSEFEYQERTNMIEQYTEFRKQYGNKNTFTWKIYYNSFILPKLIYPYDFSDKSAMDMFLFESTGNPILNLTDKIDGKFNGFLVGKHWMDATIKMWKEDLDNGVILKSELEKDFPSWFLEKVLK